MDFKTFKEICKHAAPGVVCPLTFKNCNADNCQFVFNEDVNICQYYCPIVETLEEKLERAKTDFCNADNARKSLEAYIKELHEKFIKLQEDHKLLEEHYEDTRRQCDEVEGEFNGNIEKTIDLLTSALYDLKDKLKETAKRLEP